MFVDIWRTHQLFGLLVSAAIFSILVARTMGKAYAAALFYSLASAIWLFQNPTEVWPGLMIRVDATSANAAVLLALISGVVAFSSREVVARLMLLCLLIVVGNSISVLLIGHGIFHAGSMDTATAALFVPAALHFAVYLPQKRRLIGYAFALILLAAIFSRHGNTALAMLAIMLLVYLAHQLGHKAPILSIVIVPLYFAGFIYHRYYPIDPNAVTSGRWANWIEAFAWWGPNANHWLGTGTGSYQWLSPAIAGRTTNVYLWMHNEFLQALFEHGGLGLGLFLITGALVAWKSKSNPWLFTTFAGLFVMCLAQYPFRFFLTQFVIVLLVRLAQETKNPLAPCQRAKN